MEDIYNNGEYLKNNPAWGDEDAEWKGGMIVELLKKNKIAFNTVTEVGCGTGGILHVMQNHFPNASFSGYDISSAVIERAKQSQNENLHFFNEDFASNSIGEFDLLLMIDVVEHVRDYYFFMEQLKKKAQQFIFHIPLDLSCRTVLKPHISFQQRESVGHIHYFTEEHVFWLLKDMGYRIVDFTYTKPLIDIEKPATFKNAIKKFLRNVSYSLNKKLSVKLWGGYSLLIIAE